MRTALIRSHDMEELQLWLVSSFLFINFWCVLFRMPPVLAAGGLIGSVEGCFLAPVPNSTTPMLVEVLKLIVRRSLLFGELNIAAATAYLPPSHTHQWLSIQAHLSYKFSQIDL